MNNLEKRIQLLADAYYQAQELVPDSEYDALVDLLKKTKPDSELLKKEVIGSDLKGINKKYKLPYTMGTLEKCNTIEEFEKWFEKNFVDKFVVESKVDGAGVLLQYIDGELVFAYSRGDSEYGEDLTKNIKLVGGVQENISKDFSGCIRGEVVVYNDIFEEHFKGEANPRNTAAGKLKQKDGSGCDKLNFIAYDVFSDKDSDIDSTERNKISFLKNNNFETPFYKEANSLKEIVDLRNNISELRKNLRYNIDGIVIKQFNVDKEDLKRKTPLKNCAFKAELEIKITKVKDIAWQIKGRYYSPLAIIEPVELCGTTVSKATISNVNIMKKLGIYIGADIEITKNGEIIPGVVKVLEPKENAFEIPKTCEVCGHDLVVNESGMVECINECCPRKVSHRFKKLFKVLNIKGAGDSFITNLEEAGITVEDFFEMCSNDNPTIFNKLAGGINGEKIYIQMKTAMGNKITPADYLATFDYKLFGSRKLKQLGNLTLDEMISLKFSDLINIDGFDEITANAYLHFIKNNLNEIISLRKYFTFESVYEEMPVSKGNVVFTGACSLMPRSELAQKAEKAGYVVQSSVSKTTDLLVCADPNSGSSKLVKAQKNGTKIISYEDFLKLV